MNNIIILGENSDISHWDFFIETLDKQGGAAVFSQDAVKAGKFFDTVVFKAKKINRIFPGEGIVIFENGFRSENKIEIPSDYVAVCDSSDESALFVLRQNKTRVITCSGRFDTLCFSSVNGNSGMISLQREITSFSGVVTEPCDIPADNINPLRPFFTLAAAAALLMLDKKIKF